MRLHILRMTILLMAWLGATAVIPAAGIFAASNPAATGGKGAAVSVPANLAPEQVDALLARLSDEQARQLLAAELAKTASRAGASSAAPPDLLQRLENLSGLASLRFAAVLGHVGHIPADLQKAVDRLTEGQSNASLFFAMLSFLGAFGIGLGVERLVRRCFNGFLKKIELFSPKGLLQTLVGAALRVIPEWIAIVVFGLSSTVVFLLIHGTSFSNTRMLFGALLIAVLGSRVAVALSRALCAPEQRGLRLVALSDAAVRYLHRKLSQIFILMISTWTLGLLLGRLEVARDTVIIVYVIACATLTGILVNMVLQTRQAVAEAIAADSADGSSGSLRRQLAAIWHVLALVYLLALWLFWSGRLIVLEQSVGGSLLVSLMIVPIFLVADRFGQWIVSSVVGETLAPRPSKKGGAGEASPDVTDPEGVHQQRYTVVARHIVRAAVGFALGVWLLRFWGFALPFGQAFLQATFSILVTLVLAHILWRTTIRLINRKLREEIPAQAADEGQEDEWGAAQALGRSHTLLPMVRKAIGSALVVMATMTTLSSLGIDITPLLAGAGVVGLAVGFGARKLVNDIFSGFFFLLDDAFRLGEYLKAGAVSGMVEKITLRNLFLRHHRGMLQVVPHSDLGMVTNYMRGGLVEKFNLQLPYDTDIDKVRKIIKKVGEQMLQDPEHGPNFIQPLKSQGVREVGDSVMTFRVKFTAKPGKHFLIRREAIKQITLALERAGIHYAHRKVIVDLPRLAPENPSGPGREAVTPGSAAGATADTIRSALGAAAAEEILRKAEKEKAAASQQAKDGP